ncbi:MAG TPA: cell wall hydrolase [Sphingomonas sp.]|nr:cell wall hydrolase [Sphingomonas sp.]
MAARASDSATPRRIATGVVAVTAMAVAGFAAHVGWRATHDPVGAKASVTAERTARPRATATVPFAAAPGAGVTGSMPLPSLPVSPRVAAAIVAAQTGIAAAAPFTLTGIGARDRARALECLTAAIYYEAATEGDAGQAAVAQVVLNRVRHPAFPATVCGVVYQGSERSGCQFSFACDGAAGRVPTPAGWARAARTAARSLTGRVFANVGLATHYHTYAVTPVWNRGLVMTDVVGAHFFHRWKGYWGTAAAFHQSYRGGEPMPRVPRVDKPAAPLPPVATTAETLPVSALTPSAGTNPADRLPPASQVLDRWKDSGKPLAMPARPPR